MFQRIMLELKYYEIRLNMWNKNCHEKYVFIEWRGAVWSAGFHTIRLFLMLVKPSKSTPHAFTKFLELIMTKRFLHAQTQLYHAVLRQGYFHAILPSFFNAGGYIFSPYFWIDLIPTTLIIKQPSNSIFSEKLVVETEYGVLIYFYA